MSVSFNQVSHQVSHNVSIDNQVNKNIFTCFFNKVYQLAVVIFSQIRESEKTTKVIQLPTTGNALNLQSRSELNLQSRSEGVEEVKEITSSKNKEIIGSSATFNIHYVIKAKDKEIFEELKDELETYHQAHPKKLNVALNKNYLEDNKLVLWSGYSASEFGILIELPEYHFLKKFFCNAKGTLFSRPEYSLDFDAEFAEKALLEKIKEEYFNMPKIDPSLITVNLPNYNDFTGSASEIQTILSSLLENHEGLFIGEIHSHKTPKSILKDQMKFLASIGVKTLFLEHCCYDGAIQTELDKFFETLKATPFLQHFLRRGFGAVSGNYYDMVKAAVEAGIRPIGLEKANAQSLGYHSFGGSDGADRMLGLNVSATEIIQKHKKRGKYVSLDGSAHLSYYHNIAGLSELCNAPSLIIEDASLCEYQTGIRNLNYTNKEKIIEIFGNSEQSHFVNVRLLLSERK